MGKVFARMVAIVRLLVLAKQVVFVQNSLRDSIVKLVSSIQRKSSMIVYKLFYCRKVNLYLRMNIFLDKCHPRGKETCRNGGTCEVNEEGTVSCHCSANHTGVYCDTGKISTLVKYLSLAIIRGKQW